MKPDIGWPLVTNVIRRGRINNTFGMVRRNRNGSARPHQGWDFYAPNGYRCYAIADGVVTGIRNAGAYGLQCQVKFQHDFDDDGQLDTLFAFYSHLSAVHVANGQRVNKGDQLGLTGSSGNARGMGGLDAHLHFEIRTRRWVARGLDGRMSPLAVFGHCPLHEAVEHEGPFQRIAR